MNMQTNSKNASFSGRAGVFSICFYFIGLEAALLNAARYRKPREALLQQQRSIDEKKAAEQKAGSKKQNTEAVVPEATSQMI